MTSTISPTDTINDTLYKQKETRQILLDAIATLTSLSDEEMVGYIFNLEIGNPTNLKELFLFVKDIKS